MKATTFLLRTGAPLLLAGATLLTACEKAFYSQPRVASARAVVQVAFSAAATQGGLRDALARADQLHLHLAPQADSGAAVDTLVALPGGNDSVDVSIPLAKATATYGIAAELLLTGKALFRGTGSVTLHAGQTAPAIIDLVPVATSIQLPASFGPLTSLGDTVQLRGTVLLASADSVPATLTWTSLDPANVSVTADGIAVALAEVDARVRARYQGLSADSKVVVAAVVASLSVSPASLQLQVGRSATLTALATDARFHVLARSASWSSSNSAVARVDGAGQVTAVAPGDATITAGVPGRTSAPVPVHVLPVAIAGVVIQPAAGQVVVGQTLQLAATTVDSAGNPLAGHPVSWSSSDPSIATVDGSGLVTGVKAGSVGIRAAAQQDTTKAAIAQITVTPPPAIGLSPSAVALDAILGTPTPPTATVDIGNAGGGTLSGLSVSVDYGSGPTGWLSASLAGATAPTTLALQANTSGLPVGGYGATITVASSLTGVSSAVVGVQLTVHNVPVSKVTIAPNTVSLFVGQPASLAATVIDLFGNTLTVNPVTWTIRDPTIASLSATAGAQVNVVGAGTGSSWVVATSAGVSDSARVASCLRAITPAPTSASFSTPVGQIPAAQTLALSSGGCGGPLTALSETITYAPGSPTGWLQAQLTSTSLSLAVTTGRLPAGTYTASVLVTSTEPYVQSVTVPVTLTVNAAPVISNFHTVGVSVNDPACISAGVASGGSLYTYAFDFAAPNGLNGGTLNASWVFSPSGTSGTYSIAINNLPNPTGGTFTYLVCTLYQSDTSETTTITVTDAAGLVSNSASVVDLKPAGAHSAPGTVTSSGAGNGVAAVGGATTLPRQP